MTKSTNILKIAASCAGTVVVAAGIIGVSIAVSRANASTMTADTEETEAAFQDVAIPEGRYFFNGDSESEYWIDVGDGVINLNGPDIEGEAYKTLKEQEPYMDDDQLHNCARNSVEEYLHPNEYRAVKLDGVDNVVAVMIDWNVVDGLIGGYGYDYYESSKSINWAMMGDFYLAE